MVYVSLVRLGSVFRSWHRFRQECMEDWQLPMQQSFPLHNTNVVQDAIKLNSWNATGVARRRIKHSFDFPPSQIHSHF